MYATPVFGQLSGVYLKNNYAVIGGEVFCKSLDFCLCVIHNSICVTQLIYRKLKPDCANFCQHTCKSCSHLIVSYVVTYNYHQNLKIGYVVIDFLSIKHL